MSMKGVLMGALALLLGGVWAGAQEGDAMEEALLLDDFGTEVSALGTSWEGFTDRVMGGVSDIRVRREPGGSGMVLHLMGTVSLENNGGFIQARMFLREDRKPFDAGDYAGIELRVRGRGDGYYVHLRSTRTVFPWSYYAQKVPVGEEWTVVRLPFGAFAGENMLSKTPDVRRLLSVAVVAAKKEFAADLYVDTIALYR